MQRLKRTIINGAVTIKEEQLTTIRYTGRVGLGKESLCVEKAMIFEAVGAGAPAPSNLIP